MGISRFGPCSAILRSALETMTPRSLLLVAPNNPLTQLMMCRIRQFFREPEAIFWTYGFPLLMVVGLGVAFRTKPPETIRVGVVEDAATAGLAEQLGADAGLTVEQATLEDLQQALRRGAVSVIVASAGTDGVVYHFDPTNPEGQVARGVVDDVLQRAAGRTDALTVADERVTAAGSRYVDFLVPGLIGMNLMSGGLWGIGFVLVDMRVRNLLKRLVATPMRRRDFLLSMLGTRIMFFIPEMIFLLVAAFLIFNVQVVGSVMTMVIIGLIGAASFAGIGLLVACRAQRVETITGLMNLVMLPMWMMSGVFFSSERFPDVLQPFIQVLPLTLLINALRSVMLDGVSMMSQALPLAGLMAYGVVCFMLALRWFRWQ